jgi:uncharacterized protein YdcH (DUF465 family)
MIASMSTAAQSAEIIDLLQEVLRLLCRGLPQYLVEAKPWLQSDDAPFLAALRNLIADQRHYARETAEAIVGRGGRPDAGAFALKYMSVNDLSLEYLKARILEQLREDHDRLKRFARLLADHHDLNSLVEEIEGNYRGHLEILSEKGEGGRGKAG